MRETRLCSHNSRLTVVALFVAAVNYRNLAFVGILEIKFSTFFGRRAAKSSVNAVYRLRPNGLKSSATNTWKVTEKMVSFHCRDDRCIALVCPGVSFTWSYSTHNLNWTELRVDNYTYCIVTNKYLNFRLIFGCVLVRVSGGDGVGIPLTKWHLYIFPVRLSPPHTLQRKRR